MSKKTAVVLFNLGGPDSLEAVEPFLFNLFSDPDIFKFPLAFFTQKLFARLVSRRRSAAATVAYTAIGGKSPLLDNTRQQAAGLATALRDQGEYDIHICMRYWHPMTDEVIRTLQEREYEELILLPLYPQYSITTTGSSYNEFRRQCARLRYHPKVRLIHHWYDNDYYQQAVVASIEAAAVEFSNSAPDSIELLFSAHGLPQKIVEAGDVYEQHIRATYTALCKRLNWPHTTLCYQSRVGPLKWLQPYTADVIQTKGEAGARQILVYPIAFVSDHSETLYELGIDYAHLARAAGIQDYRVVPALNDHPLLIRALAELVLDAPTRYPLESL